MGQTGPLGQSPETLLQRSIEDDCYNQPLSIDGLAKIEDFAHTPGYPDCWSSKWLHSLSDLFSIPLGENGNMLCKLDFLFLLPCVVPANPDRVRGECSHLHRPGRPGSYLRNGNDPLLQLRNPKF